VVQKISLLEIISTVVLLLAMIVVVVVDLTRVFHVVDSATLQLTHRCTPAPDGILAVPAVLPTIKLHEGPFLMKDSKGIGPIQTGLEKSLLVYACKLLEELGFYLTQIPVHCASVGSPLTQHLYHYSLQ